jgi:aspartyl-tRNA(Asn)/glutamyl-tRNA(Gln) amidotransferase subunit C
MLYYREKQKGRRMAMAITEEQVAYVANLAQIGLDETQKPRMTKDLDQLLDFMQILHTVDTEGVEPLTHVFPLTNVMRPDTVVAFDDRAALLANAPEHTEEAFVVPKIVG